MANPWGIDWGTPSSVAAAVEHYCEAKTWDQDRSGTWAGSRATNGCQRRAKGLTEDGHWACGQHMNKRPACGWN